MTYRLLAILALSFTAGSVSCSNGDNHTSGGAGTQAGGSSSTQGGHIGSGGQSTSGGASSSTGGSAGSSGSGGQSSTGGIKSSGGENGSGGATGTGGQSSAAGGTPTGGTSNAGGAAAGNPGTGGRNTTTGGSSAGGSAGSSGGTGGTLANGGSSGAGGTTAATSSVGCGKTPTMTNGAGKIGSRNYMLRIPANYDNKHPYPLVFAFHWQGGTMNDVDGGGTSGYTWSYYGLREQADNSTDHKMIFVAPDGNGGWPNSGGQDLAFVDALYKQITEDLCVDTTRVFSMGFSYGGGMTYEIACARAKTFRAAAVYSGAQLSGCDGGKDPIPYIGFHSVSDPRCSYSGGEGLRNTFVTNNGCTAQTPPRPQGLTHVCTKYTGCKPGYPVEWCAFDGGGHTPAPIDGSTNDSGGGDKTWTKAEAWAFFTQF